MESILGSRYTERRARRLIGEFVALARFGTKEISTQPETDNSTTTTTPLSPPEKSLVHSASERLRRLGSNAAIKQSRDLDDGEFESSPRRLDVEVIQFDDFLKGMVHAL